MPFSHKHHKLTPSTETILTGILGKGFNIGIEKWSQISLGLNKSTLKNTVTWCFTLKNIEAANTLLVDAMDKLALANAFQKHADHSIEIGNYSGQYSHYGLDL